MIQENSEDGGGLDEDGNDLKVKKRRRKSGEQIKMLIREFERNPNWTKETLTGVSRRTGLSEAQVYKWGWDQKRKLYGPEAAAMMMA